MKVARTVLKERCPVVIRASTLTKRDYEPRFFSPEATEVFAFDCPQSLRRAALAKAIGIYKSWRSNY